MNYRRLIEKKKKGEGNREIRRLLSALLIIIAGCSDETLTDLEDYVREVKSRPGGAIEPLPEPEPTEHFTYQAGNLRSPFTPTIVALPPDPAAKDENGSTSKIKPDPNRPREALEEYPLDSLEMVGVLERGEEIWAIIRASDGVLYRVRKGNYLGRQYGRITHIDEQQIELVELIGDEQGGWVERPSTLTLAE